eukprot:7390041-Prymnesium_polylepis.1
MQGGEGGVYYKGGWARERARGGLRGEGRDCSHACWAWWSRCGVWGRSRHGRGMHKAIRQALNRKAPIDRSSAGRSRAGQHPTFVPLCGE